MNNKTVLLTGGTGVVGAALIPQLLKNNFKVIALVRKRKLDIDGVEEIEGNVTKELMGLELERIEVMHGKIGCLIHSAALTNFDSSEEDMYNTNVNGTQNAVNVANAIGSRLLYVSTAFTHELDIPNCLQEYSAYCKTKRLAENIVRSSVKDYTIVRPSIVIGDSTTGEISTFQGLHNIVGSLLTGVAPMLPASPDSFVDLVPQDILVSSICALAERAGSQQEYWITRGESATRVLAIHDILRKFLTSKNCKSEMPKIVDPEVIDRLFKPVFLPGLPRFLRKRLNKLIDYACYFNLSTPFPCNYAQLAEEFNLKQMPDCDFALQNNLEYWAEKTNFVAKAAQ